MSKIAIIGDRDTIWPFKAFGFYLDPLRHINEAKGALEELLKKDYSIIFVTEEVFKECREEIQKVQTEPLPAIIILPNIQGSQDIGKIELQQAIRTAIGSDIL